MAGQIRMTPQELRDAANTLNQKRAEIEEAVKVIENTVNSTTANWEGSAQSQFVQNFEEMLPMLKQSFPEIVEGIASMMTGAADTIERADEEIAKAFG